MNITAEHICKALLQVKIGNYSPYAMQPQGRQFAAHNSPAKESAVMLILLQHKGTIEIIYTQRTINPKDAHSGQISFPGGRHDATDQTLRHTAQRETLEEIGIIIPDSSIIAALTPLYIPVSNYNVHPYIALLTEPPQKYTLQPSEIEHILRIPLQHLKDERNIHHEIATVHNKEIKIPYYSWHSHKIWGATAMITEEFLHYI